MVTTQARWYFDDRNDFLPRWSLAWGMSILLHLGLAWLLQLGWAKPSIKPVGNRKEPEPIWVQLVAVAQASRSPSRATGQVNLHPHPERVPPVAKARPTPPKPKQFFTKNPARLGTKKPKLSSWDLSRAMAKKTSSQQSALADKTQTPEPALATSSRFGQEDKAVRNRIVGEGLLPGPDAAQEVPLISNPRYLQPPLPPHYPSQAIRLGMQGEVIVRALVDISGKVQTVVIYRSCGHRLLDQAAQEAVARWKFVPALQNGQPISAWVQVPVRFVLKEAR